jgi:hypothetical protein
MSLTVKSNVQSSSINPSQKRLRFSLVAAFLLLLGGAGLCEAENTLVVTLQSLPSGYFPTGTKLLTPEVSPIQESSACSTEKTDVKAPQYLIIPTTVTELGAAGSRTVLVYYEFVFWNINGSAYSTERVSFNPNCGTANTATAWYRVICDPNPLPCNKCGGGGDAATVFAFSLSDDKPIIGVSPIESVSGGTWSGDPSTTVVFPTPTSTPRVDLWSSLSAYGSFVAYQLDGGVFDKSRDVTLTSPGEFVIAFYTSVVKPIPPHCPGGPTTCT